MKVEMLGELLFESRGRITSQRVLSVENGIPKFEISIIGTGIFTGSLEVTTSWTYWTIQRLKNHNERCTICGQDVEYLEHMRVQHQIGEPFSTALRNLQRRIQDLEKEVANDIVIRRLTPGIGR